MSEFCFRSDWSEVMPEKTDSSTESVKMKDANGSEGKLIKDQGQKPQSNDIKCAEIKSIPSVLNGYGDRQKNVFKIGEYNRATASFEINTPELENESRQKVEFDLSSEITPGHYFKSNFARSMVVNNANKSKSLDYNLVNRNGLKEDKPKEGRNCVVKEESDVRQREDTLWQIPGKENWDLRKAQPAEIRDDLSISCSVTSDRLRNKKADIIEEHLRNQPMLLERPGSRGSSTYQRSVSSYSDRRFDDILFRSPLTASCRSSYHRSYSSASDVDTVLLQSQVTTLQWQLRQAESSRQMHRAVLEQVVSFLQRTQKNLDQLQSRILAGDVPKINRVPRSRSVHGVDTSPSRLSESNLSFQKAKSVAQIADPYCPKHGNTLYRDMTWRRPRKQHYDPEDLTPSKLSEEAFRLLRTVQSLLNTREPDLSSRLSTGLNTVCSSPAHPAEVSSASSTVSAALDSDNSDNFHSQETLRNRTPIQDPFAEEQITRGPRSSRLRTSQGNSYEEKNSPPQLSISSADDESGFSSLNSFQEIGLPLSNSTFNGVSKQGNYHPEMMKNGLYNPDEGVNLQEVGLPRVDEVGCKIHRRWSSTPADSHISKIRTPSLTNGEILRVLWV